MSNIYQNGALRGLVMGLAIFAFVLCAATTLAVVSPIGVGTAYADLDWGAAEWGDCCSGDVAGDCCADVGAGDCCWGGDTGDCCADSGWGGECCGDGGDCCADSGWGGECCGDGGDCCADTGDCCADTGDCCDDYDDYWTDCDSCVTESGGSYGGGGGGAMYYSSSNPPKSYPMSVSYPKQYSPPPTYYPPVKVSTGTSYVQPAPTVITNTNNNTNTNVNNISVSATAVAIAPATPQYTVGYTYPTYSQPAPYCTISITNQYQYGVGYGYGQATLTWNSSNATSATIYPLIGSVSTSGSRTVYPTASQVYSMTVYGQGGTSTCQTQTYYAPSTTPAPYVSLTQIPYTGFDFGPAGNALYWISLASVAVAGAYLLVFYKGGMFAFAGSLVGGTRERKFAPIVPAFAPVLLEKEAVKKAEASVSATGDNMSFVRGENGLPQIVISRS